ncbi:MAG: 2-amino-4-hydroxy-6-hydroxymethyldihydropteridine diphosphokinase [Brevefilum sp.]|nr:2-amino-4-hydroxy-6-hydroxymethyldihydropteridine diphosphokinase [Brevefilum sp.]
MFPIINIGPLAIQAFGLILLLSFFTGSWLAARFSAGLGTNTDVIENSILVGLIAGLLGARIGFLLKNPAVFVNNLFSLVSLTPSMLDVSFGILVGLLTALIIAQKKYLPLWPTLDVLTPFFLLIFAGVHLANYANGDGFGIPTLLPWGIQLWNATRHPVQLYALLLAGVLFAWLIWHTRLLKTTGFNRSGVLFSVILGGMAIITLFTRAFTAEKILLGAIDFNQAVSFAVLLASLGLIYTRAFPNRKKVSVIISMGSNVDPHTQLSKAVEVIAEEFRLRRTSSRYQTQDVLEGHQAQDFINQVIEVETELAYPDLVKQLKAVEVSLGRQPGNKITVALDLDVLTYGSEVFTIQGKHIPDPGMLKYRYIALPLAEMSPDFRHPGNGMSIRDILEKITDDTQVLKINEVENGIEI